MVGRIPKNTVQDWINMAQRTLIEEGIAGLKVDRLATHLGVTRGGFYHHFKDRDDLLDQLIRHWEQSCRFLPDDPPPPTATGAIGWLDRTIERLIGSGGYDDRFDLAVRDWARAERRAAQAIERIDGDRIGTLRSFFEAIGYGAEHAEVRARVFYYHQIGYHAIGVRQSVADRRENARLYLDILCGREAIEAARASASNLRDDDIAG